MKYQLINRADDQGTLLKIIFIRFSNITHTYYRPTTTITTTTQPVIRATGRYNQSSYRRYVIKKKYVYTYNNYNRNKKLKNQRYSTRVKIVLATGHGRGRGIAIAAARTPLSRAHLTSSYSAIVPTRHIAYIQMSGTDPQSVQLSSSIDFHKELRPQTDPLFRTNANMKMVSFSEICLLRPPIHRFYIIVFCITGVAYCVFS